MNNRQTNKTAQAMTAKGFALLSVLLITACDGGIFGTGGPDEPIVVDGSLDTSNGVSDISTDGGTTGSTSTETDGGTTGDDAGFDAGSTGGAAGTDGGSDGSDGGTDGNNVGEQTDSAGVQAPSTGVATAGDDDGRFVNNTPTLSVADRRINIINTTTLSLNVFETSVEPEAILFNAAGIAPGTVSNTATLTNSQTSLAVVDNTNVGESIVSYPEFDAAQATLTTLIIRESDTLISAIAVATQTQTTDPTLVKLRVIQAGTLGDASVEAVVQVQSTGTNPGGMNAAFGPVSYSAPQTDYIELPAGDYELQDDAIRFDPQVLSLAGGTVYTVVLLGNGATSILLVDDSASSQVAQ